MFNSDSHPLSDLQVEKLIRQAGFRQPTPLQRVVIPALSAQKDTIIRTGGCKGKTAAIIASAIINSSSSKTGLNSLILTGSGQDIKKFTTTAHRFLARRKKTPQTVCLGFDDNTKKELRQLNRKPAIIIGTTDRVIDHIRRGNINLEEVNEIIINCPEQEENGFINDVLFIYSKLPRKKTSVLFCGDNLPGEPLTRLIKRPVTLTPDDWSEFQIEHRIYQADDKDHKVSLLLKIILANSISRGIIFTNDNDAVKEIEKKLNGIGIFILFSASGRGVGNVLADRTFIITDNPHNLNCYQETDHVFITDLKNIHNEYSELTSLLAEHTRLITVFSPDEARYIKTLEEKNKVKFDKKQEPQDAEVISGKLKTILSRIRSDEDPEILDWYKRLFKKTVPIHLRGYVAALLLKESQGFKSSGSPARAIKGDFATLFVSIGKNRRVFPKDLSGLICNAMDMPSSNIGPIKVLDNYSFVEINPKFAQQAINKLDGTDFRGRKITVNFARKKD